MPCIANLAANTFLRKISTEIRRVPSIDPDNTFTHIYTYLYMDTMLEFKELFLCSVLAYNTRTTTGLLTIGFTFRNHS